MGVSKWTISIFKFLKEIEIYAKAIIFTQKDSRMKYVKLWGGLGNQMFQYVFGQYLEKLHGEEVVYINDKATGDLGQLRISRFRIKSNQVEGLVDRSMHRYFNKHYRIKRFLLKKFPFLSGKILVEGDIAAVVSDTAGYRIFDGYWQCLEYLAGSESLIREQFQLKDEAEFRDAVYYPQIQKVNSVSVHVRRGDFLTSSFHYELPLDYYQKAIEHICSVTADPVFFVFTNDIPWAKEHFNLHANTVFVNQASVRDADLSDFI